MPKLIVNPTSAARREIALSRTLLSIGRDPGNDLVLPDAMVSRRHAVIECRGSQYFIRDCNSSNGSLVNGDKVSERSLRDGDLVAIGTARLLFRDEFDMEGGAKVLLHPSSPRLHCGVCGADYRKGDQFCRQCGGALAPSLPPKAVCSACGTAIPLPAQFCTACGRALEDAPAGAPAGDAAAEPPKAAKPAPEAEPPLNRLTDPVPPAPLDRPSRAALPAVKPASPQPAPRPSPPAPQREAAVRAAAPPRPAKQFPDTFRESVPSQRPAPPAGAAARFGAAVVDHILAGLIQSLVIAPVVWFWWSRPVPAHAGDAPLVPLLVSLCMVPVAAALGCMYFVYGWGVRGQTPGKALFGLAVEGSDGAYPIGVAKAIGRLLAYALSSAVLGIGHLMILFGGSALHDKVAGTRVVRHERP